MSDEQVHDEDVNEDDVDGHRYHGWSEQGGNAVSEEAGGAPGH